MSNQLHTIPLSGTAGEFTLTLPVGAEQCSVEDGGTFSYVGDASAETETRSFVLAHKNSALPTGTLTRVGSFVPPEPRLFLFEVT